MAMAHGAVAAAVELRLCWRLLLLSTTPCVVDGVYWVKSHEGQSCTEACTDGCLEDARHYPNTTAEFEEILNKTGYECISIVEGGMRYDPSIDSGQECGFHQWRSMPWTFCELRAPPMTYRFCPCTGEEDLPGTTAAEPFDCHEEAKNVSEVQRKREWCCNYLGVSCLPETMKEVEVPPAPYQCQAGLNDWERGWSPGKIAYCCERPEIRCIKTTREKVTGSVDLHVDHARQFAADTQVRARLKQAIAMGAGAGEDAVSVTIKANQAEAEEAASGEEEPLQVRRRLQAKDSAVNAQVIYVVSARQGRVASAGDTENEEDVDQVLMTLQAMTLDAWHELIDNCTSNRGFSPYRVVVVKIGEVGKGEGPSSPSPVATPEGRRHDCEAGLANWRVGWSSQKKWWCCSHEEKGCSEAHATIDEVSWFRELYIGVLLLMAFLALVLCISRALAGHDGPK